MARNSSRSLGLRIGVAVVVLAVIGLALGFSYYQRKKQALGPTSSRFRGSLANNHLMPNAGGDAATFSPRGSVNLSGEFFKAQGKNGQSCASCHIPEEAWSITPATLQKLFDETDGKAPVFSPLDANNPNMDISTKEARRAAYSMLLTKGLFRRGGAPRPDSEWELIAVDDPHGLASLNLMVEWRRPQPTINFPVGSSTVNWDGVNTMGEDLHAGLVKQTGKLITGALQGPPPTPQLVNEIVDFETSLFTAQVTRPGMGRLDADGARGGPEALASMPKVEGPFNLFDAWANSPDPKRAQVYRGQQVFNSMNANHSSCNFCHDAANNGTNMSNILFDIDTASADVRTPDLPLYTFRNKETGKILQLTDAGLGQFTGRWIDLGDFKTPSLRGLAARAPYFHNGIAPTLEDVVHHYETRLGFVFTDQERADLVAFLKAL